MVDTVLSTLLGGEVSVFWEKHFSHISGGRPVTSYAAPAELMAFVLPDGPNTVQLHEDAGAQITTNLHLYFRGQAAVKNYDRVTYAGQAYFLRGVEWRPKGNFTYAYGKNINRAETESTSG